jgi:hypothetical protein
MASIEDTSARTYQDRRNRKLAAGGTLKTNEVLKRGASRATCVVYYRYLGSYGADKVDQERSGSFSVVLKNSKKKGNDDRKFHR